MKFSREMGIDVRNSAKILSFLCPNLLIALNYRLVVFVEKAFSGMCSEFALQEVIAIKENFKKLLNLFSMYYFITKV
jgi:hypothetical protein